MAYDYDAEDRRVKKQVPVWGYTRHYVHNEEDVIAEYDHAGGLSLEFVHGPGHDEPLVMDTSSQRYYYIHDALGSIVALSHSNGDHLLGYAYEPYGKPYAVGHGNNVRVEWGGDDVLLSSINPGVLASQLALLNPYGFTGQRWDWETGLLYYKARYYDPAAGRFINRDPIGSWTDSVNLGNAYAYVGSDPTGNTDPSGEYCLSIWRQSCRGENGHDFCDGTAAAGWSWTPIGGVCGIREKKHNYDATGDICGFGNWDWNEEIPWSRADGRDGKHVFICVFDTGMIALDFIPALAALRTGKKVVEHAPEGGRLLKEAAERLGRGGDESVGGVRAKPNGPRSLVGSGVGLDAKVTSQWAKGNSRTVEESLTYHFGKHGAGRTLEQYTDDAMRFWQTNKGQAQWGRWNPNWEPSYRLKIGDQNGYYTRDGRILTYWDT